MVRGKTSNARKGVSTSRLLQLDYGVNPDDIGASLEIYYQTPFVRYQDKDRKSVV